jgi:hypothetical protein
MAKMHKLDSRGSGPMWFLALAMVIFALYSMAVAASTAEKCDIYGGGKTWQVLPPEWKCDVRRG